MNYLVISDTHGHLEKVYDMYEKLSEMTLDGEPIDKIIHCGDYQRDGASIGDYLAKPTISVAGNCDGGRGRDFRITEACGVRILVTHGHSEGVDYGLDRLCYLAEENDCEVACFGHTHVPVFRKESGILLINPGSLTFPRDGTAGSCALLNITEDRIDGGIYYYENLFGKQERKKNAGGFLRGLLNYSDRF